MKTASTLLAIILGWVAVLADDGRADVAPPPVNSRNNEKWQDLFKPDLSNAIYPAGVWSMQVGILTASEDKNIWTEKQYENFVLDLEFKNAPGTNSGVFVYGSELRHPTPNSIEVQICDDFAKVWADKPASWRCGAIFGRLAPTKSVVKKPGEWNHMTVTCRGPIISVVLNGEKINEIDLRKWTSATKNPDGSDIPPWLSRPAAELPTKGHIGLQGKHAGAPIFFRNIKIKSLEPERGHDKAAERAATEKLRKLKILVITEPPDKRVMSVNFCGIKVDDDMLALLDDFPDLLSLNMADCNITGDQLRHVAGLTELASLVLANTQIDDDGLAHFAQLKKLESLHLRDTKISDTGLDHVASLGALKVLDLQKTKVTDAGMKKLRALKGLKWLLISDTAVTDAGLEHLAAIKSLGRLTAVGTKITQAGVTKLKRAIPALHVDTELNLPRSTTARVGKP
jgi:hypothetical protein